MDLIDNSLFESRFRPRLQDKLSKFQYPLPDVEAKQATSWVVLFTETDESLEKRSSSNRSIRRQARFFARNVYAISAELFLLCSLSYSISGLPKIPPGTFYEQLKEWWVSCLRPEPLALATSIICCNLPPNKSENSSMPERENHDILFEAVPRRVLSAGRDEDLIAPYHGQEQNPKEPGQEEEPIHKIYDKPDRQPPKRPRLEPQVLGMCNCKAQRSHGSYFQEIRRYLAMALISLSHS